jgi:glutamyl/glutaminyl-tRNA synthetase
LWPRPFRPISTGYLRVGGALLALFNWLFLDATVACSCCIEDTDLSASSPEI